MNSVFDLKWNQHVTYGELYHRNEVEQSTYNFQASDPTWLASQFSEHEEQALRLIGERLVMPAYEHILRCSHTFNLLDARGVLGRDERMTHILKIRKLSEKLARTYLRQRFDLGFPLMPAAEQEAALASYREKFLSKTASET